jgi:hypothetical protein
VHASPIVIAHDPLEEQHDPVNRGQVTPGWHVPPVAQEPEQSACSVIEHESSNAQHVPLGCTHAAVSHDPPVAHIPGVAPRAHCALLVNWQDPSGKQQVPTAHGMNTPSMSNVST